jgi:hypothetical protein
MNDDERKPLTLDEIEADLKNKPKIDKPKDHFGVPRAVGHTGISLGHQDKPRTYNRDVVDDDDIPNGGTIGARISDTTRK